MKYSLLFLTLFFVFFNPSYSQVRTGGAFGTSGGHVLSAQALIDQFEKDLVLRDTICGPTKGLLKESDLLQSYLKLSVIKNTKSTPDECSENERYFACLSDESFKKNLAFLKNNPYVAQELANKYNIDKEEALRLIHFFEEISKSK